MPLEKHVIAPLCRIVIDAALHVNVRHGRARACLGVGEYLVRGLWREITQVQCHNTSWLQPALSDVLTILNAALTHGFLLMEEFRLFDHLFVMPDLTRLASRVRLKHL
jgi:hypothetical protein